MLTDLGQLIHEGTKMKRALEMAKIAIPHRYKPISTRVKRAMADLVDKQEIGEYVQMKAEYALKFKKTTDRKPLDPTAIKDLLVAIRDAVNGIAPDTLDLIEDCLFMEKSCRNQKLSVGRLHWANSAAHSAAHSLAVVDLQTIVELDQFWLIT